MNKFNQDYANEYCRPTKNDDNFKGPYQGMLPLYCYKNKILKDDYFNNLILFRICYKMVIKYFF